MGQPIQLYDHSGKQFSQTNPLVTRNESIGKIIRVDVPMNVSGIVRIDCPEGTYGMVAKRLPVEDLEVAFNGDISNFIPLDPGDQISPFQRLEKIELKVNTPSSIPAVILLFTI